MRDILTSPQLERMKHKRKVARIRLALLLSIFCVVLGGGIAYFSAAPQVTLSHIVVEGTQVIDPFEVQKAIEAKLQGRYMYLFARSNSFIYPKGTIEKVLRTQFPRIATLTITRDTFTTLHISIAERSGASLYCGETMPDAVRDRGDHCFYINNDGLVFDTAPYFSGNIYFSYYKEHKGPILGEQLFSPEEFHVLARWVDRITSLGFKPVSLVIDKDGVYTLYLAHNPTDTEPKIIAKTFENLDTMADNLAISMSKSEFSNEIKLKYSQLLYIDLRFKNKVLYKFNE